MRSHPEHTCFRGPGVHRRPLGDMGVLVCCEGGCLLNFATQIVLISCRRSPQPSIGEDTNSLERAPLPPSTSTYLHSALFEVRPVDYTSVHCRFPVSEGVPCQAKRGLESMNDTHTPPPPPCFRVVLHRLSTTKNAGKS